MNQEGSQGHELRIDITRTRTCWQPSELITSKAKRVWKNQEVIISRTRRGLGALNTDQIPLKREDFCSKLSHSPDTDSSTSDPVRTVFAQDPTEL